MGASEAVLPTCPDALRGLVTAELFLPITISAPRGPGLVVRNRAFVAPMCQYSVAAEDGVPTNWHLQHLGAFAAGGFGLVVAEATAVEARGRISARDIGLWNDEQVTAHRRIVEFVHSQGAAAAIQLAHAGGKASTYPWLPGHADGSLPRSDGGWLAIAPSEGAILDDLAPAMEMTVDEIAHVVEAFGSAAQRAESAGYDMVQLHAAHGYLINEFLSPLTNHRQDEYGGDPLRRMRFGIEVAEAVRAGWPRHKPVGIRVSATDWNSRGLDVDATIAFLQQLVSRGLISWVDVSSGGLRTDIPIPDGHDYQLGLAARVKRGLEAQQVVVSAVGRIIAPSQAESVVATGLAHAVSIGRAALRNPHWAAEAASQLGVPARNNPSAPQLWRAGW